MPDFFHFHSSCGIPQRVISLVPSITESLFDLGFGASVIGVTDFCIAPAEAKERIHLGGPKQLNINEIIRLSPDLILANQEENSQSDIIALQKAGLRLWLAFPHTVRDSIDDLFTLARLFQSDKAIERIRHLEKVFEWEKTAAAHGRVIRYFCPIWMDSTGQERWWMTFNQETYSHDLLACLGYQNVFTHRQRRYPLLADLGEISPEDPAGRDTRYPRVPEHEVVNQQPDLILLPTEPYAFDSGSVQQVRNYFAETPAGRNDRVILVDGSLLTWHGTHLARSLAELPSLLAGVFE